MTDLTGSDTDAHSVLRFSAHATTVTHLLSLQDDRDNLASPEQASNITTMMHTFIGMIIFVNSN